MPTRFPSGITTANLNSTLQNYDAPDHMKYHSYLNDFDTYVATDWIVTVIGTGTQALAAVDGGALLLTNSAAAPDSIFMQLKLASFVPIAGKKSFLKTRFKISSATLSTLQVGLVIASATPLTATDGIFFMKSAAVATLDVYVRKDTTTGNNTTAAVATIVSDTFLTLGWEFDGRGNVSFYKDDVKITTLDASATYLPDAILALSFGMGNGSAVAQNMTVDYVFAATER